MYQTQEQQAQKCCTPDYHKTLFNDGWLANATGIIHPAGDCRLSGVFTSVCSWLLVSWHDRIRKLAGTDVRRCRELLADHSRRTHGL